MHLLFSLFGFVVVDRFLSRLEKFKIISASKRNFFFVASVFPLYVLVIFKEQIIYFTVYIGLFLISLMSFYYYFEKTLENSFPQRQILLLDTLILQMSVGSSPQKALHIALKSISAREKRVFEPLQHIFSDDFSEKQIQFSFSKSFILELRHLLRGTSRVMEQLQSFRQGLKIQINLRHKSRQASMQTRAQAVVAAFVYAVIFFISNQYLGLAQNFPAMLTSLLLFTAGLVLIFKMGDNIKWRI